MSDKIKIDIKENIEIISAVFRDCDDVVQRSFFAGENNKTEVFMVYIDNLASADVIENPVMTNLMLWSKIKFSAQDEKLSQIMDNALSVGEVKKVYGISDVFDAVLVGDTALLADKCQYALVVSTKAWPTRGVPEAQNEVVVQGPKDAFNESGSTNTVLIRRRIRDTRLKVKRMETGVRSKTGIAVLYMQDVVRPAVLMETMKRLESIDIDSIPDSGFLQQLMEKSWLSPFPQMQLTERPDKAAAGILDGRVAVIVDNTPFVLLAPATFNVFFQAAEDYYERWGIMSFLRFVRYTAAFLAVSLQGLYIALTVYHPLMLPAALALKIAVTRQRVPFPTVVEVLIMELAFELLREAGIRLPAPVSSTIGIVGGIIIGQAAVEAGIVGPVVVIISALSGICTFVIPNTSLVSGLRLSKYLIIFFSSVLGLLGYWIGLLLLLIHLSSLKSFGIPYLYPFCSGEINDFGDIKDSFFRAPLFALRNRSIFSNPKERVRMGKKPRG